MRGVLSTQLAFFLPRWRPLLQLRQLPLKKRHPSSSAAATCSVFSDLQTPTARDAHELWLRMRSRPCSVLQAFDKKSDVTASQSLDKYNIDWTRTYKGRSSLVVRPNSTEEVAAILRYCHSHKLPVVPQGGNTGLVGGSVPLRDEIVLSLEHLNQVHGLRDNILRADAGCILQDLQEYTARRHNCMVPVDLGAKGTCQIGGNLSTNAGGVYYYRYGSLHANCLGLQVVDGTGQILPLGSRFDHLKDNTGYHLHHLFIGAEGTLGVITQVALWCPPRPTSVGAVWLTCRSLQDILQLLALAKTQYLTEILAAFEFMDHDVLRLVQRTHQDVKLPVDVHSGKDNEDNNNPQHQYYSVLIETHGSNEEHDQDKLSTFLEHVLQRELVLDGVVAQSMGHVDEFWKVRDTCNPAAAATGFVYKYDVSLAVDNFDNFIQEIKSKLHSMPLDIRQQTAARDIQCVNWGHIIDGNLHCNVVSVGNFERNSVLMDYIEQSIFEAVTKRKGSISAEHGLGQYKNKYMDQINDAATLQMMRQVKQLFDPSGILNPGKYFPNENKR